MKPSAVQCGNAYENDNDDDDDFDHDDEDDDDDGIYNEMMNSPVP